MNFNFKQLGLNPASLPLEEGDKPSFGVAEVQEKLFKLGYRGKDGKELVRDGLFGTNTDHAVRQFQGYNNLPETGIVTAQVWGVLNSPAARGPNSLRQSEPGQTTESIPKPWLSQGRPDPTKPVGMMIAGLPLWQVGLMAMGGIAMAGLLVWMFGKKNKFAPVSGSVVGSVGYERLLGGDPAGADCSKCPRLPAKTKLKDAEVIDAVVEA